MSHTIISSTKKVKKGPSCSGKEEDKVEESANPLHALENLFNKQNSNGSGGAGFLSQLSQMGSMRSLIKEVNIDNKGHINVDFNLGKRK